MKSVKEGWARRTANVMVDNNVFSNVIFRVRILNVKIPETSILLVFTSALFEWEVPVTPNFTW